MVRGTTFIFALCGLLAAGCATMNLEGGMDSFIGQSADSVIEALGFPHTDEQIAGKRVLSWTSATSRGWGDDYLYYRRPYYSGILSRYSTYNYGCTLRFILNENDVVDSWDHQGSLGHCGKYRSILQERVQMP